MKGSPPPQSGFESIRRLVRDTTGFAAPQVLADNMDAAISRAMRNAGAVCAKDYAQLLNESPAALADLLDEATVRETSFFRDPQPLREFVKARAPALRLRGSPVRVWSAGCASGEEAYTAAMLLVEEGLEPLVYGTDLSPAAIARARAARYGKWSLRGVEDAALQRYFTHDRGGWTPVERIRRRTRFAVGNLLDGPPAALSGSADLVLCRNVLLYMHPDFFAPAVDALTSALAPGGWLIAAASDPPLPARAMLKAISTRWGVVHQRAEITPPPAPTAPAPLRILNPPVAPAAASPAATLVVPPAAEPSGEDVLAQVESRLSGGDLAGARAQIASQLERRPLWAPLHLMHALALRAADQAEQARAAIARAVYLDRDFAFAHYLQGLWARDAGALALARRSFRAARDVCARLPSEAEVPLAGGERAAALQHAAAAELRRLESQRR